MRTVKRFIYGCLFVLLIFGSIFGAVASRNYVFWGDTEEIEFRSGTTRLVGTIAFPEGTAPYPFVVMAHGSGPETRNDIGTHSAAKFFNKLGFAVLFFDKRGAGESSGDFNQSGLVEFQSDLSAAIDYVVSREDTDQNRLGLYSVSESSWYAPQVALSQPKISFLIQKVGTTFGWSETVAWEVENDAINAGVDRKGAKEVASLAILRWNYIAAVSHDPKLASGALRDNLAQEAMRILKTVENADQVLSESIPEFESESFSRFAANYAFDPSQALQSLDIPVLFLLGETDINIPTKRVVAQIEEWQSEGMQNLQFKIFDGVGHSLFAPSGIWDGGFVPGYFDEIDAWMSGFDKQ
jgi:pimeloyl-ACP methyl ester carboxylesterase